MLSTKKTLIAGLRFLVALLNLTGATVAQTGSAEHARVIPFRELQNGMIALDLVLSPNKPATFIFDTGSSISVLLDDVVADQNGLDTVPAPQKIEIDNQGSETKLPRSWRRATLSIQDVELAKGDFPSADLSSFSDFLGEKITGLIGLPLALNNALTIDYDKHELIFTKANKLQKQKGSIELKIRPSRTRLLLVDGTMLSKRCDRFRGRFYLDSGSDRDLVLGATFAEAHPDFLFGAVSDGGALSELSYVTAEVNSIEIADRIVMIKDAVALKQSSTALLDQEAEAGLGAPFMRRFTTTIDFARSRVYLQPRNGTEYPNAKRSGCRQALD